MKGSGKTIKHMAMAYINILMVQFMKVSGLMTVNEVKARKLGLMILTIRVTFSMVIIGIFKIK
jgi:hypothetical protein